MTVSATVKSVRVSTRKVRLVADTVRNMPVDQAIATLTLTHKRGASILITVIKSAMANAVNNAKLSQGNLIIDRLEVQEGPFLKRFRPSTRGRVHPFKKRSSHVTVVLKEKREKEKSISPKREIEEKKEK